MKLKKKSPGDLKEQKSRLKTDFPTNKIKVRRQQDNIFRKKGKQFANVKFYYIENILQE